MAKNEAEKAILEATRAAVSRYARLAGWEVEKDALDAKGWEGVFVAEGGEPQRFAARRHAGANFTTFAWPIALEGPHALRRAEVQALIAESDLAARERQKALEATTRIWDGGLNRETFDAVTGSFLELDDSVRALLKRS
jgi:hypothetical protein